MFSFLGGGYTIGAGIEKISLTLYTSGVSAYKLLKGVHVRIKGISAEQMERIAEDIAVRVQIREDRGNFLRVRLFPLRDHFRRTSASYFNPGRRVNAVCWHGHLAFFREVYRVSPDAVIHTAMASYRSSEDLERDKWDSYDKNVGPQIAPVAYGDVCLCN
jgi:hypothetical protein